jgi:hypothetical protein
MNAAAPGGLRLLPGGRARTTAARALPILVGLAFLALLIALWAGLSSDRHAIQALPVEQRLASLARTVAELREVCRDGRQVGLGEHCRELASYAALFDECRGECATLVQQQLARAPTR